MYVSDWTNDRITVYETSGQYVTSFGRLVRERESSDPHTVSPLVSVGVYMCVIVTTIEYKCFKLTLLYCVILYYYIHTCWSCYFDVYSCKILLLIILYYYYEIIMMNNNHNIININIYY